MFKGKLVEKYDPTLFALSVSKYKTFDTCHAKYRYSYIEKLPKKEWEFQVFGKFLHEVLELFEKEIIAGYTGQDHTLMKKVFDQALANWSEKMTKEQMNECHKIMLGYLKKRNDLRLENKLPTPLAAEKQFNVDISRKVLINGFIDLLQQDADGVLHVADYKTSKDKRFLKKDLFQLKTYAYVMALEDPTWTKIRTSYIMLKHNFEVIAKEFTREEVLEIEDIFLKKAEDINSEKLFRPNPGPLCKYCDYSNVCPAIKKQENEDDFGETEWL